MESPCTSLIYSYIRVLATLRGVGFCKCRAHCEYLVVGVVVDRVVKKLALVLFYIFLKLLSSIAIRCDMMQYETTALARKIDPAGLATTQLPTHYCGVSARVWRPGSARVT